MSGIEENEKCFIVKNVVMKKSQNNRELFQKKILYIKSKFDLILGRNVQHSSCMIFVNSVK